MEKEKQDQLESVFVDNNSMSTVLEALASIAIAKAEHIRTNYQDTTLAKSWDHIARQIDFCRTTIDLDSKLVAGLL